VADGFRISNFRAAADAEQAGFGMHRDGGATIRARNLLRQLGRPLGEQRFERPLGESLGNQNGHRFEAGEIGLGEGTGVGGSPAGDNLAPAAGQLEKFRLLLLGQGRRSHVPCPHALGERREGEPLLSL
jgi:hypothetical protein